MGGKNNYVMRRLDAKKGDSYQRLIFYAKYQRVPRSQLLPVMMKRKYKITAAPKGRGRRPVRKGQRGQGFHSRLKNS